MKFKEVRWIGRNQIIISKLTILKFIIIEKIDINIKIGDYEIKETKFKLKLKHEKV